MNRHSYLTLLAALALTTAAGAQTTYFATGFDDGMPAGFTLHDEDRRTPSTDMQKLGFAVGTPWIVTTEGKDNNKVACSTSWYKNAGQSNDWMVTSAIKVEDAGAVLRWRARASDKDYRDGYKVYISEKGTAVSDFDTSAPVFSSAKENYEWTSHELSLAPFAGKTVYIAFVNDSKDKNCLFVDDIFAGIPSAVGLKLNLGRVSTEYGDLTLSGKAFATGGKSVTGYTIGYRFKGKTVEEHFNGTLTTAATDFSLATPFHMDRNETADMEAWIKSGADSTGVRQRVSAYPWKLVSEEVTGTWCGYCVRGIVAMKNMKTRYPDSFIGIAIHNSQPQWPDAMAAGVEEYHNALYSRCKISGYPHCVFNRDPSLSTDPAEMEYYYEQIRKYYSNNCGVQLTANYDAATGKINAHTDIWFSEDIEKADYRLAYVVVENNVHRTHEDLGIPEKKATGYEQNNYYAGTSDDMGGFENLPSTVPAEQMWYNDVARAIYPDYDGIAGVLPETIEEGRHYFHDYTLELTPNVLEKQNTELIVLLLNGSGVIANADKVEIGNLTDGIVSPATVRNASAGRDSWYDLNGRRLDSSATGLVIHNGRKEIKQ